MLEVAVRKNADLKQPDKNCVDREGHRCVLRDGMLCRAVIALTHPDLLRKLPDMENLYERKLASPDEIPTCQKLVTAADIRDVTVYSHLALPDPEQKGQSGKLDADQIAEAVYREVGYRWEAGYKQANGLNHREFRLGLQIGARAGVSSDSPLDMFSERRIADYAWERFKKEIPELGGKSVCDLVASDLILRHSVRIDVRRNQYLVQDYVREVLGWWDEQTNTPAYHHDLLINCGKLEGRKLDGVVMLAGETFRFIQDKYDQISGPVAHSGYTMLEDRTRKY